MSSMEQLARQYGPPPEGSTVVDPATATFETSRPSKEEARAALANMEATGAPDIPEDVEDIDPHQWLQHDDSLVIGYVVTRAGRLKIAALDETEQDQVRKLAERDRRPGKPQMGKDINLKLLRLWTVAYSLNKAYGWRGTTNEISAEQISRNSKLSGEITTIVQQISELSGYREDSSTASNFLSVS